MTTIRRATATDLTELSILFDLYRVFYNKETDLPGAKKFLEEVLRTNASVIFLADEDGKVIGFTQLYPQFSSTRMKKFWLLNDLYVLQEYRGKGVSKQLIETAKEWTRQTNATGLLLETGKDNHIGNQLYPSTGFSLYNETNFYWWENS